MKIKRIVIYGKTVIAPEIPDNGVQFASENSEIQIGIFWGGAYSIQRFCRIEYDDRINLNYE